MPRVLRIAVVGGVALVYPPSPRPSHPTEDKCTVTVKKLESITRREKASRGGAGRHGLEVKGNELLGPFPFLSFFFRRNLKKLCAT